MTAFQLSRESIEARDPAADAQTLAQRIEAFRDIEPRDAPDLIIGADKTPAAPGDVCIPVIDAAELTATTLRNAVVDHGALHVKGLFDPATLTPLIPAIDNVLDAVASPREERAKFAAHYFNPPSNLVSIMPEKAMELGSLRLFGTASGSAMCVEAPSIAESLLELYESYGLKELVTDYLGEAPCLSVKKWVLRRSVLPVEENGWHQDGAFMGTDINTINLWIPLTTCGGDTGAPGMDLVPVRLNKIVSAQGATFDWSVSDDEVHASFAGSEPVAPVFELGDAFFFDHFYLHRTQYREQFTDLRYAVETWFFGASAFSKSQVPIAW